MASKPNKINISFKTKEHGERKPSQGNSTSMTKAHENKIGVRALGFGQPGK
jgi:hypothetical protein